MAGSSIIIQRESTHGVFVAAALLLTQCLPVSLPSLMPFAQVGASTHKPPLQMRLLQHT